MPRTPAGRFAIGAIAALAALVATPRPGLAQATGSYQVDPKQSVVSIAVGKSGAFSFLAGHTHQVTGPIASGTVEVDAGNLPHSHVHIAIASASLKVTGKGEPPDDVPKVQEAMESDKVLWIARYPQLIFDSAFITPTKNEPPAMDLTINGSLTIRDVKRPTTVPVHVEFAGNTITVTGRFSVKQTDYGIKPITVAGVVAVKDALDIRFSIVARR
jgi:polyisoprenoid-binding protein YceI